MDDNYIKYYRVGIERSCRCGCEYVSYLIRAENEEKAKEMALKSMPKWTLDYAEELVWHDNICILEAGSIDR